MRHSTNKMRKIIISAIVLIVCIAIVSALQPIPESRVGYATLNEAPATYGTPITIEVYNAGEVVGSTTVQYPDGGYSLDIIFDDPDTPEDEGANEGDQLTWKINGIDCSTPAPGTDTATPGGRNNNFNIAASSADNPPSVTVLHPNGGESIPIGTQVQLSAQATDDTAVTSVTFSYSNNSGSDWNPIGAGTRVSGTAKDGIWNGTWNTDSLDAGSNYLIRAVADDGTSTREDRSDSTFSLTCTPPSAPALNDPGTTDTDGSYTVSWSSVSGATSYTLEEDTSGSFGSPTVVYSGSGTSKYITGRSDGTYYYRVNACNTCGCSGWSNVEDIGVSILHEEEGWNRTFGGAGYDVAYDVQQTIDGGYILAGSTESYGAGLTDAWLVKTDSNGNEQWNQTFGEDYDQDWATSVQQTSDGGYIFAGDLLVKTDAFGNELWNKTFGGCIWARSCHETTDGGYIIAGAKRSSSAAPADVWLIKTDSDGDEQWNKTFGCESNNDEPQSVQQTADGGYIIVGSTLPSGGWSDIWLIKTYPNGSEQWNKTFAYGLWGYDWGVSVRQASDGSYIIVGETNSWIYDIWLIKTDQNGDMLWNKILGGAESDEARDIQLTSDGGYVIAGYTQSFGAGSKDVWLVKTDFEGIEQWNRTFGGTGNDIAYSVQQTYNGDYILAGCTESYGAGSSDFWLIKLGTAAHMRGDLNSDGILTPADAAIALELAASGGWDPAADVDGDNHITSLDALMILQAAADAIDL